MMKSDLSCVVEMVIQIHLSCVLIIEVDKYGEVHLKCEDYEYLKNVVKG